MPKRSFAPDVGVLDEPLGPELDDRTIVKPRPVRPERGWRRTVHLLTGGLIDPGVGPKEERRRALVERARAQLFGSHQVAVLSLKGGIGKTTTAALLGLVLAEHRGDRVIVLDANPVAGSLADRLTGEPAATVQDLLDGIDAVESLPDVVRYTSLAGRLQVLASDQDPARSTAFDRADYERVCAVLRRYYNIVITDSGTGMVHSAMAGTLALADSIVIVGSLTVDGAGRASKTLDWLEAHGFTTLAGRAVVVLSADRASSEVDAARLRGHFASRCRAVVEIPRDPHLVAGGRIDVAALRPPTRDAALQLAALVADEFGVRA